MFLWRYQPSWELDDFSHHICRRMKLMINAVFRHFRTHYGLQGGHLMVRVTQFKRDAPADNPYQGKNKIILTQWKLPSL
jgi:hypothetical protein